MASFQAKIGWERPRKIEKKIVPMSSQPTRNREFLKNSKKIQKLKNTIMASFQAKIGWKLPRMKENRKNPSDEFLPDPKQRIPKKQQKNLKS